MGKIKFILFIILFGFAGALVVFGEPSPFKTWLKELGEQEAVVVKDNTSTSVQPVVLPDITSQQTSFLTIEKIREGRERLKNSPPLKFVEKTTKERLRSGKTTTITKLVKKEIELEVLDMETGNIFEKRYWLDEKEIEKANAVRRSYLENKDNLPRFTSDNPTEIFQVTTNWWNNFNSDLSIADSGKPEEKDRYIIIGNKFLLGNENFAYFSEQTRDNYSDMVYVPVPIPVSNEPPPALYRPEFVETGKDNLNRWVASAFQKLRDLKIMSKVFPGQLVADSFKEVFVKNILLTEQTDPSMLLLADDKEKKKLVERTLVRIALNGERAYRYTFSKTEASGLGQIMLKTYSYVDPKTKKGKGIVQIYPEAKLITDTDIGRIEVINAIMASVLVFDSHLKDAFQGMTKKEKARLDKKLAAEPDFINQIAAAVYNGGPRKYLQTTAAIFTGNKETALFVKKYKIIRDMELFVP